MDLRRSQDEGDKEWLQNFSERNLLETSNSKTEKEVNIAEI
jgi:hypothetical protein